jgi:hypothetical protein
MASYTARVELHAATNTDYETLHTAMQSRGYLRTIVGSDGKTYWLPTGTYDAPSATVDLTKARNIAAEAAQQTGKTFEVFVVERGQAAWQGLKQKTN